MVTKTYTVPLHRKIASGIIKPTESIRSDFYLENENNIRKEVNINTPRAEIFNIEKKSNGLIVYSNTLNFKITMKYFNKIPLYKGIVINRFNLNLALIDLYSICGEEYLVEDIDSEFVAVFFNYKKSIITLNANDYIVRNVVDIGSSINHPPNVKIRKLKERLKIEIQGIDSELCTVELNSPNLLEPIIHNNWVEFSECVIKDLTGNFIHIYNHSFNLVEKEEHQETKYKTLHNLKDPFWDFFPTVTEETILDYTKYKYTSWRSNLLINTEFSSSMYFYLNLNYVNKTDLIIYSLHEKIEENLILLYSITNDKSNYQLELNPYLTNKLIEPASENFSLVFEENKNNKYNRVDNIRFGTERVVLSLSSTVLNTEVYLQDGGEFVYQTPVINSITTPTFTTVSKPTVTQNIENKLSILNGKINEIINNQSVQFTDNIKQYFRLNINPPEVG